MVLQTTSKLQAGRAAIVTGASSGIGREIALRLAAAGTRVIAVGRDNDRLGHLAASADGIEPLVCDIAATSEAKRLVEASIAHHGPVDVLINNAAIQKDTRFDDEAYGVAEIENEIAINLIAPIVLSRLLLPHLLARSRATIVNVTTGLAFVPKRTASVYSASKAGLHLFSDALRVQMRGSNLRIVEAVMPMVDTPMTSGRGSGKISPHVAAEAVIAGLWSGPETLYIGKARLLPPLLRFAPGVAARILQRS